MSYFLKQPGFQRHLSPLDICSALCAALLHDCGHGGVNNNLLQAPRDELAITCKRRVGPLHAAKSSLHAVKS